MAKWLKSWEINILLACDDGFGEGLGFPPHPPTLIGGQSDLPPKSNMQLAKALKPKRCSVNGGAHRVVKLAGSLSV